MVLDSSGKWVPGCQLTCLGLSSALLTREVLAIQSKKGFQRGDMSSYKRLLRDIEEVAESLGREHPGKKFYLFGHSSFVLA